MTTYIYGNKNWQSDAFNELSLEHQNLFFRLFLSSKKLGSKKAPVYVCENAITVAKSVGYTKEMIVDLCAESFLESFEDAIGELGK